MPVTVKLPTPLRRHAGQAKAVEVRAGTVGEALSQLAAAYPGLQPALFGRAGDLKTFIRIYVGNQDIADLQGPATPVQPGDIISIVPPVAGA